MFRVKVLVVSFKIGGYLSTPKHLHVLVYGLAKGHQFHITPTTFVAYP